MVHCRASHLDAGILHTGILLEFRGSLDTTSAPRAHRCLIDAAESGDFVIVDLTEAEAIDESGLYALEAALRESRQLGGISSSWRRRDRRSAGPSSPPPSPRLDSSATA